MTRNKPAGAGALPALESTATWQQIIIRKKKSGVAFLLLDSPGKGNFLTSEFIDELDLALTSVADDSSVKSVVVISGKADTFVAGADLHEIMRFSDRAHGLKLSRRGHAVFAALADMQKPTVAAINGACLGGGLELALCCHRRVATDAPITVLGLPEVRHGFVPGLGGTQRLPRQIGIGGAMEMILGGEIVNSQRALEMNIVDQIVSADNLMQHAEQLALELLDVPPGERKVIGPELEPEKLSKLFAVCERSVRIKTKGRYPAQLRVLEVIKTGLLEGIEAGFEAEINAFADLSVSEVSRNLVFLFFTTELAKQHAAIAIGSSHKSINTVTILSSGRESAAKLTSLAIASELKVSHLEISEPTLSVTDAANLRSADLIIEAVSEDKNIKLKLLSEIANLIKPDTVLATVTSSLSITELAASMPNNQNLIGMQFIHPVDKMPLVEVISHANTSKLAVAQATNFIRKIGKVSVSVHDGPGFLLNRILTIYLLQAARMAESGIPINWLEASAVAFGMPIGPLAVLDEVGLDLAHTVASALSEKLGDRFTMPNSLSKALRAGMSGRESGFGTYIWQNNERIELNPELQTKVGFVISTDTLAADQAEELAESMILPMVDEAARCLDEKIVRRARDLDFCMVMGMGFPYFRGGLLRYADSVGIRKVNQRIQKIYTQSAPANEVSNYLKRLEQENRGFYSRAVEQN